MSFKKTGLFISSIIVAVIIGLLIGYFIGNGQAKSRYETARELDIRLNRGELEGLGEIEGPIYVTGHKTPDSDTVCSAIAYAALLQMMGYDAHPVVLGEINHETKYILEQAGIEAPPLLDDASGCNMILVDHSEYAQSAEGLKDASILMIIDHHGDGSVTTGNPLIYDARPIGATSTIIWMRYRNYGFEPDGKVAFALAGAILSDTVNLESVSTTSADIEAFSALSKLAGLNDKDAFYQNMFIASLSYEGMTAEEIILSDYKEYEGGGQKFAIGVINVYDKDAALQMVESIKGTLPGMAEKTGMDMTFVQISIFHDDMNITYLLPSDEAAAEVIETAYGDTAIYDGTSYMLEPGISRKKDLVPAITAILEAHPQE
ncbi:MAG: DHH family phosphoesterase [Lachnospiraceae bacterium]|nr:DHH family phosphoesterase [Lachnospiraceae bacterium]